MPQLKSISPEELLDKIKNEIPTFIFGTGVSIGLCGNPKLASWPGLLQEILRAWEPHMLNRPPSASAPAWVLAQSTDGDCLVAAGYVLRRQMAIHSMNSSSAKNFSKAARDAVVKLCEVANAKMNDPANDASKLSGSIEKLGSLVREGRARLATTNYDDLIAKQAKLKVLLPDGRLFEPIGADQQGTAPFEPTYGVPEPLQRMRVWMTIADSAADREDIASVLHLHGWHGQEDAIVIDPVSYHEICHHPEGTHKEEARIIDDCNRVIEECMIQGPVIFYGMGSGMMDPHFEMLRRNAKNGRDTRTSPSDWNNLAETNFWLLPKDEISGMDSSWQAQLGELSVTIVPVDSPSHLQPLLAEIIKILAD